MAILGQTVSWNGEDKSNPFSNSSLNSTNLPILEMEGKKLASLAICYLPTTVHTLFLILTTTLRGRPDIPY